MIIDEYVYEIKKSKFIGLLYEVDSIQEVNNILSNIKKEHKKAKHIPYAYIINGIEKKTDDKEPHNTAGMPIYNLLKIKKQNNRLLVIIRYFGGIKLGANVLTRTYANVAKNLVCKNEEEL